VKRWNFRKADWSRFCFLTGESVELLPPPDATKIEKAYQELCESLLFLLQNNPSHEAVARTMCHVGIKSARPSIAPSSEPQWGLTDKVASPYFQVSTRRVRSDGKKLSNPPILAVQPQKREAPSTNLLAGQGNSDLPITVSRMYAYADDLAIMHADGDWQAVEGVLSKDIATVIGKYFYIWKLKLGTTKTVSTAAASLCKEGPMAKLKCAPFAKNLYIRCVHNFYEK